MEHMRQAAFATVLRACGFGSLAIFCVMIGLSFEPRAAFQAGGFLTTLMAGILMFKAHEALTKNYRRTEMWLYLAEEVRPPEAYAQWASSTVLRETYLTFAKWTSADCHCHVVLGAGVLAPRHVTVIPLARSRRRGGPSAINGRLTIARPSANTGIMSRKIVQGVIGRSLQCSSLMRPGFDRRLIDRERSESRGHQGG